MMTRMWVFDRYFETTKAQARRLVVHQMWQHMHNRAITVSNREGLSGKATAVRRNMSETCGGRKAVDRSLTPKMFHLQGCEV